MQFAIVIEKSATGYSAYAPDLPGCVATARTEAEVRKLIGEGIEIYLDETRRDGDPLPVPTSRVEYLQVEEAATEYAVVVEKGPVSYGVYVPDLPGCVAAAETEAEVMRLIREAIVFHLEGMRLNSEAIPEPTTRVEYVTVESTPAAE
jgi:predicted RNase H-like HicB family nuclease